MKQLEKKSKFKSTNQIESNKYIRKGNPKLMNGSSSNKYINSQKNIGTGY